MPVGGGKQIGVEEMQQSAVRVGATHKRTDQVAEIPIKVRKSNVRSSELEEQLPAAQGYDFEKMIQEAMEKAGEKPAVKGLKGMKPSMKKQTSDNELEDEGPVNNKTKSARKLDPKKQALLEKRKKYDPRAAIKNSKKSVDIRAV